MTTPSTYKHWTVTRDAKDYCWLILDRKNATANTLGHEVLEELDDIVTEINVNPPKALAIKSGKKTGFIAGADISEFLHLETAEAATAMVRNTQQLFDKLSALPFPTVAVIDGFCLGGGLELSLACKYRVALDSPKTKIGLPEILLGVQPGWGGSIRLPKLIGSLKALELIIAGKIVDARTAYKLGIVDAAVPERQLLIAIEYYLSGAAPVKQAGKLERFIQLSFMRALISKIFKYQVAKKVAARYYPAPFAVIDAWVNNSIYSPQAMQAEAESIGKLMVTPTARNLVRVFFLRDRLKAFAKAAKFTPQHVHVVGAGVMGGDIAAWCALSGFTVTVQDQYLPAIAATLKRAQQLFSKKLKLPYLVQAARDRLMPDIDGLGIAKADVIIEAIIENAQAKQDLFTLLETKAKPNAILATNTSTIPLATIGEKLKNPQRVVGIHFFNPVPLMQLVEVVADTNTDKQVVENAMVFVGKIDKLPLPVKSAPGFLVNRVLIEYLLESAALYLEGVPGPVIDRAATDYGMMMGPIELMDNIGLDICIAAAGSLGKPLPELVVNMVKNGQLGKKTGSGFYVYKNGKLIKPKVDPAVKIPEDITDRLIMRLINEATACLREGIVTDGDLVDAGLIFGAGFAPFRGGPMTYVAEQQKANIKARLESLASRYGVRFEPDPGW